MKSLTILYIIILMLFSIPVVSKAGLEWSQPILLSPESYSDAYRQYLGYYRGVLHVAWKDHSDILDSGRDWDIFYRYRTINGGWSPIELVSDNCNGDSTCLSLDVDTLGRVHIAWQDSSNLFNSDSDRDIFYRYRTINGGWSPIELVSNESKGMSGCPFIAADSLGRVHIVWADNGINGSDSDLDVFYREIINGTLGPIELISINSSEDDFTPRIAVDNLLNLHVVWYEKSSNTYTVYYAYKPYDGYWSKPEVVSINCSGSSVEPCIVTDSKYNVHIIWNDNTNLNCGYDYDIFYRIKYKDDSWSSIKVISKNSHIDCKWPWMTIDQNDTIYIAWCDKVSGSDYDVVLTYKENDKWIPAEIVSKNSSYDSNWPRMVIDSNQTIHMTWWDDVDGHWEIFYSYGYKKNPVENNTSFSILPYLLLALLLLVFLKRHD